jgi:hypothetical protein
MLQLLSCLLKVKLGLLQLTNIGSGNVIAAHFHGGTYFGVEVDHLAFKTFFILGQEFFRSHYLGYGIVQLRHSISHIADGLLEYELRIFCLFDNPSKEGTH